MVNGVLWWYIQMYTKVGACHAHHTEREKSNETNRAAYINIYRFSAYTAMPFSSSSAFLLFFRKIPFYFVYFIPLVFFFFSFCLLYNILLFGLRVCVVYNNHTHPHTPHNILHIFFYFFFLIFLIVFSSPTIFTELYAALQTTQITVQCHGITYWGMYCLLVPHSLLFPFRCRHHCRHRAGLLYGRCVCQLLHIVYFVRHLQGFLKKTSLKTLLTCPHSLLFCYY